MTDTMWRQRAACRDADPELFFPSGEKGPIHDAQVAEAKAVCSRCAVRPACLSEALERMPYGVAGGLSEQERQQLRRSGMHDGRSAGPASGSAP